MFVLGGCAYFGEKKTEGKWQPFAQYLGPKVDISVADFELIASKINIDSAEGLKKLLINTLTESNRFNIINQEPKSTQTQEKKAKVIVKVNILEFEPQFSGGKAGIGGGGGVNSGALGGLLNVSSSKAYILLDVSLLDAVSSNVIASTRLKGQSSDVEKFQIPLSNAEPFSSKGLNAYNHTPMENALRVSMLETAKFIIQNMPQDYYSNN